MPVQDWSVNTKKGAAGEMYGIATTNSQRLTRSVEAEQNVYGLCVQEGAAANTVKVGLDDGFAFGVTMRENKLESAKRPGDGTVLIPKGQPLAIMVSGPINILAKTAISGKEVGVNSKGEFGGVGGDYVAVKNIQAIEYPIAAGDVGAVMVNVLPVKA